MSESQPGVRARRRRARRLDIQAAACRLVVAHGFDGFTMDDLAREVGVSRRTLFNHVSDKMSAVLGEDADAFAPHALGEFCAGGPAGELVADTVHLVRSALQEAEVEVPDACDRLLLVERAIAADPKLAAAKKRQCEGSVGDVVAALCAREGWVDSDLRARVLSARIIGLVLVVLDEVVRRRGAGSFVDIFDEVLAADAEVFGAAALSASLPSSGPAPLSSSLPASPPAS